MKNTLILWQIEMITETTTIIMIWKNMEEMSDEDKEKTLNYCRTQLIGLKKRLECLGRREQKACDYLSSPIRQLNILCSSETENLNILFCLVYYACTSKLVRLRRNSIYFLFSHKRRLNNTNNHFSINDERLPTVQRIRDLRVILNSSLTFSDHFATTLRKAHQRINIFFNVLRRSKMDIFVKCFVIYIRPILEYGTIVFSPVLKEQIKLLEGVQKSFLFRCYKKFNYTYISYFDCFRDHNLESLEFRRLLSDLVFMYKTLVSREIAVAHCPVCPALSHSLSRFIIII